MEARAPTGPGDRTARPRVLFLTRKWAPAVGGMETYSHELAAELAALTPTDVAALPGRPDGRPPAPAALLGYGLRMLGRLAVAGRRYDVIHAGDLVLLPLLWWARLVAPRARLVASAHGTDIALADRRGVLARVYAAYLRLAAALAGPTTVIANSAATAAICTRRGFRNITVVPLAVRLPADAEDTATAEAGLPPADPYLLFVGRLVRRKGLGWFVREVLPRIPEPLTVKVAGTVWDADEGAALQHPRVEFLGPVFGADLARLRRHATAILMPNIPDSFEGFGLTALEAAADGVLLAARLDGIEEAVRDGETGFLLPSQDAAAWATAVAEVAAWTPEQRSAHRVRARAALVRHYDWSLVARRTVAAYATDGATGTAPGDPCGSRSEAS